MRLFINRIVISWEIFKEVAGLMVQLGIIAVTLYVSGGVVMFATNQYTDEVWFARLFVGLTMVIVFWAMWKMLFSCPLRLGVVRLILHFDDLKRGQLTRHL
jgi:hypothetical protein